MLPHPGVSSSLGLPQSPLRPAQGTRWAPSREISGDQLWLGLRKDKMERLTWRPFFFTGADIFLALVGGVGRLVQLYGDGKHLLGRASADEWTVESVQCVKVKCTDLWPYLILYHEYITVRCTYCNVLCLSVCKRYLMLYNHNIPFFKKRVKIYT